MTDDITQQQKDRLADDLLNGAEAIGNFLGVPVHAVYHIHKKKRLPIGKLGKIYIASKTKLRRAVNALTSVFIIVCLVSLFALL
jgi:hypothetical protein